MCSCGGVHDLFCLYPSMYAHTKKIWYATIWNLTGSISQVNRTTASCVHNTCLRVYSITLESQNLDNSDGCRQSTSDGSNGMHHYACSTRIRFFTPIKYINYHVSVGDLLLDDISVGVGLLFIIRKQLLQGSEGGVCLGFLLVGAPPFKLLPVNFHLKDRRKPPSI